MKTKQTFHKLLLLCMQKNDSEDFIDVSQRSAGTSSVSTK